MTDYIEQDHLASRPVFMNGALSVVENEQALGAIGFTTCLSAPLMDALDQTVSPDDAGPADGGELANAPEILRCFADDLESAGLAGEKRTAQIIYLAATSRLFSQPLSVAIKGPSSGGKCYTVQNALRFLPEEACLTLTSASERALIYTEQDLRHRVLVLYEAMPSRKAVEGLTCYGVC